MAVKRYNGTTWEVYAGNDSGSRPGVHSSTHDGGGSDELRGRLTFNSQTGSYTLTLNDEGVYRCVAINSASATTVTIPALSFPAGSMVNIAQQGAGIVTVAAGAGVTLYAPKGAKSVGQGAVITLLQISTNTWALFGSATT
jgi:hypothetical protein